MGATTSVIFVTTTVLLRQRYACHDKPVFVMTKHIFCHEKSMLVAAKFCRNQIMFVATTKKVTTNLCCNKHMFAAKKVLSWLAYFVTIKDMFCHDKHVCCNKHVFVMTRIILVAVPANDIQAIPQSARQLELKAHIMDWIFSHWALNELNL